MLKQTANLLRQCVTTIRIAQDPICRAEADEDVSLSHFGKEIF